MTHIWYDSILKVLFFYGSAYLLGRWVLRGGLRVNYARKLVQFILFFLPIILASRHAARPPAWAMALDGLLYLVCIASFARPLRSRSSVLATAFASIDRPEDRPFTLLWLFTQAVATYLVSVLMVVWLGHHGPRELVLISVLVVGIGDGLAEPVGIRFGKRKYNVKALFTDRTYTRSLEGSACVFLSGVLAVALLRHYFTDQQFLLSMAVIPLAMTLAEALAPHTWDGPLLYLVGGTSQVAVLKLCTWLPPV